MSTTCKDLDSVDRLSNHFPNLNLKDKIHPKGASPRPGKIENCGKWECFVLHPAKHDRIEHPFGSV